MHTVALPSRRAEVIGTLGFELDEFQVAALDALDAGKSVVVAAPTGSGKTVVAEYAVARALAEGGKVFYTTPLKALSNQKYYDLARAYGAERVGLLTGDNSINGGAEVVVMTTEVLRNMIYSSSPALSGLRYVVLDEVHYLQDAYRGPVWEEVIVHAPKDVGLVCLSATVSNAEELASWIEAVRGETAAVVEHRRPVELHDLYLVGDRASERLLLLPTLVAGRPNPQALALDTAGIPRPGWGRRRRRLFSPRRAETIELLDEQGMLPAIYFIFSRAGCDEAVAQLLRHGGRLTTVEERREIRALAEEHVGGLCDEDLQALGYSEWLEGLEAGYASHHAGLVPPFKEAVEACFVRGLVKVVFATETLSLGINMPARTVVIEKLTKFAGEHHEPLTPGEYTQLTGRAGRRGIDEVGFAVVPWSPFVAFDQVAGLARAPAEPLGSSFRPTYNMAANLVRRYEPEEAHRLLNLSFAQYRADAAVVHLEARLERAKAELAEARAAAHCELGEVEEYRRALQEAKQGSSKAAQVAAALAGVRPGDVLFVPGGKSGGRVAVLSTSHRRAGDVRVRAITPGRRLLSLGPRDFAAPPRPVARLELPSPYAPRNAAFQRHVAAALVSARISGAGRSKRGARQPAALPEHPVASCPHSKAHLRALQRAERLAREVKSLEAEVRSRGKSLAHQFDQVLALLAQWGYLEGWKLTGAGERLAGLYHECDLLVAEAIGRGLLDNLTPPELAGVCAAFTYEARRPARSEGPGRTGGRSGRSARHLPTAAMTLRFDAIEALASELNSAEEAAGLPLTRAPDPGFADLAYSWASGGSLEALISDEEMSGGDFVRNVKQLIDLLRQLAERAAPPELAERAGTAADLLFRGIVAASSAVAAPGARAG